LTVNFLGNEWVGVCKNLVRTWCDACKMMV